MSNLSDLKEPMSIAGGCNVNRRRLLTGSAALALGGARFSLTRALAAPEFETVYYPSGSTRIEAYLYRPPGRGPFPLVIYNHGSRAGYERAEIPCRFLADPLRAAAYAVLVPERRGYGKSEGSPPNYAEGFVSLLQAETDNVLAAADFARSLSFVDIRRLGIMGWSLGGIVTMFAIARADIFRGAIDQAGGALTWHSHPEIRSALAVAAKATKTPVLFMDAANDATTDSVTTLSQVMDETGIAHQLKIYGAFSPRDTPGPIAPGHLLFGNEGVSIWLGDALAFLGAALA